MPAWTAAVSQGRTSVAPGDFALSAGGLTWQTDSISITLAPDYDPHKHTLLSRMKFQCWCFKRCEPIHERLGPEHLEATHVQN